MKTAPASPNTNQINKVLPFYLTTIGTGESQEHVIRSSGCENYLWLHCNKGKCILILNNKEYKICSNEGVFISPDIPYEYYSSEEPCQTHFITFNGISVAPLLNLLDISSFEIYKLTDVLILDRIMKDISDTILSDNPLREFICSQLVYHFIICFKNNIVSTKKNNYSFSYLQPVINYIEKSYYKKITLKELALVMHITPQHLCRLFKKNYNMRPFEYVALLRIKKAKDMLISPANYTIKEISYTVGYSDTNYFSSIFKTYEGITPNEYRNCNLLNFQH